jgi:hypothetical protein
MGRKVDAVEVDDSGDGEKSTGIFPKWDDQVKQNRPPVGERRWCPLARDLYDPGHRVLVVTKV